MAYSSSFIHPDAFPLTSSQLVNTVGKRMLQHLAGDELLVDLEMQNPELRRCAFAGPGRRGPQPAMLLLPLDFGTPGLHGKHSVGHLEGVYMARARLLASYALFSSSVLLTRRCGCSATLTACRRWG